MRTIKPFEEFIWEGIAIKTAPNKERAKSFIMESARKMQSLNEFITKIGIKKENANDCLEYSYDVMMFLSRAKMHLDGYAAKGSHEAEVSYLQTFGFSHQDLQFADQMRYFRNQILYYGRAIDLEYAEKAVAFIKQNYSLMTTIIKKSMDQKERP